MNDTRRVHCLETSEQLVEQVLPVALCERNVSDDLLQARVHQFVDKVYARPVGDRRAAGRRAATSRVQGASGCILGQPRSIEQSRWLNQFARDWRSQARSLKVSRHFAANACA